jgi:hypothetical protein
VCSLPSILAWEDDCPWECLLPASLPSRYPPRWLHQSELINIFVLPYIIIIPLACSKRVTIKKWKIKYKKIPSLAKYQPQSIPLNTMLNRQGLS